MQSAIKITHNEQVKQMMPVLLMVVLAENLKNVEMSAVQYAKIGTQGRTVEKKKSKPARILK